jgi:predicted AAA+ superfamily ATPase
MLKRNIESKLQQMATKFPVIAITGPRQSGKTTLCKKLFSKYKFVTLENPDTKQFAQEDPKGFLIEYNDKVIIDEVQNVPELFSYIQGIVDDSGKTGQYILTGSQNFLLLEKISQTLAGRIYIYHLLPFSFTELKSKKTDQYYHIFN